MTGMGEGSAANAKQNKRNQKLCGRFLYHDSHPRLFQVSAVKILNCNRIMQALCKIQHSELFSGADLSDAWQGISCLAMTARLAGSFGAILNTMDDAHFTAPIARHIWDAKYRYRVGAVVYDVTIADTWRRIAHALAAADSDEEAWQARFYGILRDFKFLPGGRIQAGAGTSHKVTLFNCFVMGTIADSIDGIFDALKEGALTMQQGGGVGYDFSTLRPRGTQAYGVG
jgi:hypothetical protein